jgi:DNA-directed RNA polymerase, mitochondrial
MSRRSKPIDEFDHSVKRVVEAEDYRWRGTGFPTTRQGSAILREYLPQLEEVIRADRGSSKRDKKLWKTLKDVKNLPLRLLVAGINLCANHDIDTDDDDDPSTPYPASCDSFRDDTLFIGRNLISQRGNELQVRAGAWGIDMLRRLPIFGLDGRVLFLRLTDALDIRLTDEVKRVVMSNPWLLPLDTPPVPWSQVDAGGLPSTHWAHPISLLTRRSAELERAVRRAIKRGRMSMVLAGINALQAVPFVINEPVLNVVMKMRPTVPVLPERFTRHLTKRGNLPTWLTKKEDAALRWQMEKLQAESWDRDMIYAEYAATLKRFWVPLQMDLRGRLYGVPYFNFQLGDHVRGLFLLADGERIGEDGLQSLKVHVAALADGNDWSDVAKPSRLNKEERIAWVDRNLQHLRRVGEDVERGVPTHRPEDEPIQFLAACFELYRALQEGPDFITRLPLSFDGSCNGLQHYCAITRDEHVGRLVNLIDSDTIEDFYSHVAARANTLLASWGVNSQIDRDLAKQPTMSYFYGVTLSGMRRQIRKFLAKNNQSMADAFKIAKVIYQAVEDTAPVAAEVRNLFRDLAGVCADNDTLLRWTNPLGQPVFNHAYKPICKIIPVYLNSQRRRVKLAIGDDTNKPNRKKAKQAAAANFIHSLDAAHLQNLARVANLEGIQMVTVHDSFACLAPHAARFNELIRDTFFMLHRPGFSLLNVLASAANDLPDGVALPTEAPKWGGLDISEIRKSFFAFS